jgi:hypothetical protein
MRTSFALLALFASSAFAIFDSTGFAQPGCTGDVHGYPTNPGRASVPETSPVRSHAGDTAKCHDLTVSGFTTRSLAFNTNRVLKLYTVWSH